MKEFICINCNKKIIMTDNIILNTIYLCPNCNKYFTFKIDENGQTIQMKEYILPEVYK